LARLRRFSLRRGRSRDSVDDDEHRAGAGAGVRFVLRHDRLRALTAYLGLNNVCNQAFLTGLIAYLEVVQNRPPAEVGLAFGAYGAGFLVAAALAAWAGRWLGPGGSVIGSSLLSAGGVAALALSAAPGSARSLTPSIDVSLLLIVLGAFLVGFAAPLFNVQSVSLRLAVTPPELLGRVNAVVKLVSQGALPLGALAAGGLFGVLAPGPAFWVIAAVSFAATGLLVHSPLRAGGSTT